MDIEVVFNEKLDRITCATLLTETLKYLLFHRFQIPTLFDQLKAEDERERSKETSNKPVPTTVKKKRQLIADIEELLINIFRLFLQVDIFDVLLVLGATVINPNETYSIKFRNIPNINEAERLKVVGLTGKENGLASRSKFVDQCCRKLARTLFTDSNLNECGEMKCTSIHCFILAPRDTHIDWFKPKTSFKLPKKGKFYSIYVQSESNGEQRDTVGHEGTEDMLWFQASTVIKGYKEPYKETIKSSYGGKQAN